MRVQELIPAGAEIAFIDSDPAGCLQDFDTNEGWADALIGPGACMLLFDNEAIPPSGTGFIEVCKDAGLDLSVPRDPDIDEEVLGVPFDFTITEPDGSEQEITVLGGQCSAPIVVAAGVVRVTEHANPGFTLIDVFTIPEDRLLDENLLNRTVDVEVPTSDNPNDETQVHFVNVRDRAQLKICKALGPGSSAFIGERFTFSAVASTGQSTEVTITAAASTQCVIVKDFPTGASVLVTELNPMPYSTVSCSPNPITISAGINTVTCTNTAQGKLEICKFVTDEISGLLLNREFRFSVSGGVGTVRVRANRCSPPILVTPGTYTVTEFADTATGNTMQDFELDTSHPSGGIAVTPSTAELSRNTLARSVTIAVPWAGPAGDEVRVDFYNRIRRGQIKVCKHITPGSADSLGGKTFLFDVRTTHPAFPGPFIVGPLAPEECALVTIGGSVANIPILRPTGSPTIVVALEIANPAGGLASPPYDLVSPPPPLGTYYVSDLSLQGGRPGTFGSACVPVTYSPTGKHCLSNQLFTAQLAHASWILSPNTNTIHFTNSAGDP